ncbi:sulfotransferase [Methylocaldum sp. MU1018]
MTPSEQFPIICIGQMKAGTTWLYELFGHFSDIWRAPVKELHFLDVYEQVGSTNIDQRLNFDVNQNNEALLEFGRVIWRPEFNTFVEQFGLLKEHLLPDSAMQQLKWWNLFLFSERNWDWYEQLFQWPYPKKFADITPSYSETCSADTIALLAQKMPNVRVIFLLRNPLSRLISHFGWGKKYSAPVAELLFDWKLFQKLLDSGDSEDGIKSQFEGMLAYSRANDHLKKWSAHIPQSQIFVGFLDDIVNHQHEFVSSLANFLDSDFILSPDWLLPAVNNADSLLRVDYRVIEWIADWCEREAWALADCIGGLPEWWAQDIVKLRSTLSKGAMEWRYKGIVTPDIPFSSGVWSEKNKQRDLAGYCPSTQKKESEF